MNEAYIVGAARTPVGSFGGSLKEVSAAELGTIVISEALRRAGVPPEAVDEVIMGNVLQAGLGLNPARQAAVRAGIPVGTPSFTVNKVCGSGLKAVALAAQAVRSGDAGIAVAGGMENMSRAPYLLAGARWGYRMGNAELLDSMVTDGLWDMFNNYHMGITAENLAEKYGITRAQQDAHAFESQMRAKRAMERGVFREEIILVMVPHKKGGSILFETDEFPRPDTSPEKLAALRPAFREDGTVTAGNSSGINDGAAAAVIASGKALREIGGEPLARIVSYASVGVDPAYMGIGPVEATRAALRKAGLSLDDIGLFEVNEAFSAQFLAVRMELGLDPERVNVNGGAVALGHPIGASGARILVTLLHEMRRRGAERGLATLCIGGGMGIAMVVERE
jgi:acetyl-CoA C-acetyltransferase